MISLTNKRERNGEMEFPTMEAESINIYIYRERERERERQATLFGGGDRHLLPSRNNIEFFVEVPSLCNTHELRT